jgi:hypothetical protein
LDERFYFIDNNFPELLYYGTQAGFDWILANGGAPSRYNPDPSRIEGNYYMMPCRVGGEAWVEPWEIREMLGPVN